MRLPMLYEATVELPYQGTTAKAERFIIDGFPRGISREEHAHELVVRNYPGAVAFSIRLMRPKEVRATIPREEILRRHVVGMAVQHIHLLSLVEEEDKLANKSNNYGREEI